MILRRYRRRTIDVEAMQNDGTDECAEAIAAWARSHGAMATAMPIGTVEEDPTKAYVHIPNPRAQQIAAPGFYVVWLSEDKFHVVSARDFEYLYYEIDSAEEPS